MNVLSARRAARDQNRAKGSRASASSLLGRPARTASFFALCLVVPALLVIGNFILGARAPITLYPEDDISLIDPVWRLVQGNQLGIDYHDPRGFGLFYLAAALWRLLGPHYYVLRAAADLFALVIVGCACFVAARQLRRSVVLSAVFCVTVAFEASAPSVYGATADFGMSMSYDRLIMAALLVLFVQSFARGWDSRQERDYLALFVTALLLNILFLAKISGLVVGVAIIAAGEAIVRRPLSRRMIDALIVLGLLLVMIAVDFIITGTRLGPLIEEYRLAAQGRTGTYSLRDAISFALQWTVLVVVALTALYALSQPAGRSRVDLKRCGFAIAWFWVFQVVLNMSNGTGSHSLLFLAPGVVFAVLTLADPPEAGDFWDGLWRRIYPSTLNEISARHLLPCLIVGAVLAHEGVGSLRAMKLESSISSGAIKPVRIAADAGNGIVLETLVKDPYDNSVFASINDAVQALQRLGVTHQVIANLDFANPFPALFLSPDPKPGSAYWDLGDLPRGYKVNGADVIGDACIVTRPKRPIWQGNYQAPLIAAVKPHLEAAFKVIYEDELWEIWQKTAGCGVPARPN